MANQSGHKFQVKEVVQIGYAVKDIGPVVEKWSSLYGIGPWTYAENSGVDAKGRPWKARMASAYVGSLQIELVQPVEGRIFQSRFLDTWGEGVHHIAFYVDDVDAEAANLVVQGAKILVQSPGRFAYLDAGGVGGAVFELITRPRNGGNR